MLASPQLKQVMLEVSEEPPTQEAEHRLAASTSLEARWQRQYAPHWDHTVQQVLPIQAWAATSGNSQQAILGSEY
ncbi:hypothetical protein P5770_28210 [Bacillus cereus]|nr:hypothetical protein [Bacillus cereus]